MTLTQVRAKFKTLSGRYDLVTALGADNGADWFINQGIMLLDTTQITNKSVARYQKDVAAGAFQLNFQYCRAITEVWMMNADGRFKLEKKNLKDIREIYAKAPADLTQGQPLYYAPTVIGLSPAQLALKTSDYSTSFTYDHEDIMFSDEGDQSIYDSIVWSPPVDGTYTVEVWGLFFSKTLSADTDQNFWTALHPLAVLYAALYVLETTYGNTEGANDRWGSLNKYLVGIDRDVAEQMSAEYLVMEG